MMNKDLLAPKEMTSAELKEVIDEWVKQGGVITQCEPGVALNFRTAEIPQVKKPVAVKRLIKKKRPVQSTKKKTKKTKR